MAPESAEEHFARAEKLAWEDKKYPEAEDEYARAIELDPKMAKAYLRRGQVFDNKTTRDLVRAQEDIERAIELAPDWAEAYLQLGLVLSDRHQYTQALDQYEKAIRFDPKDPRPWIWRGSDLKKLKRHPEAIKAIEKGLNLKPSYGEMATMLMLADAYMANGQRIEAINTWKRVLDMDPVWRDDYASQKNARKKLAEFDKVSK